MVSMDRKQSFHSFSVPMNRDLRGILPIKSYVSFESDKIKPFKNHSLSIGVLNLSVMPEVFSRASTLRHAQGDTRHGEPVEPWIPAFLPAGRHGAGMTDQQNLHLDNQGVIL